MEIDENLIAMATGTAEIDDENVIEVRRIYAELYEKFKEKIAPEAQAVRDAGGLFILGTERHESRRIDNQLRGRSGRQGDPGESKFFLSLEDDLMRLFGSERMIGLVDRLGLDDDTPIDARILSNQIENAQKKIEDSNFKRRKYVLMYDDVMNQQRTVIYKQRQSVLDGENVSKKIIDMMENTIFDTVESYTRAETPADWDFDALRNHYNGLLCDENDFRYTEDELAKLDKDDITDMLIDRAEKLYRSKEELFGEEIFREVERSVLLRNVDKQWMEHIDAMDDLKESIGLQSYAQRNPVNEYRIVGSDMFDAMINEIREGTVRTILTVFPRTAVQRAQVAKQTGFGGDGAAKKTVVRRPAAPQKPKGITVSGKEKIGRNDPCPCGSGKKYKNCCGSPAGREQA